MNNKNNRSQTPTAASGLSRRHFIWGILITLVLAGGVILGQLTFGTGGMWAKSVAGSHFSLLWAAGALLKYGFTLLFTTALLWFMTSIAGRRTTVSDAGHAWLLGLGSTLSLLVLAIGYNVVGTTQSVYNAVFLLTRNAYPLITGIIVWLLLQPLLLKWTSDLRLRLLVGALLVGNIIFPLDVLRLGSGTTVQGVLFSGVIAMIIAQPATKMKMRWLWLIAGGYAVTLLMGWIQFSRQGAIAQAFRFVTATSPLVIIPAAVIVYLLRRLGRPEAPTAPAAHRVGLASQLVIPLAILLTTGTSFRYLFQYWLPLMRKAFTFAHSLWVVVAAFLFLIALVVIALLLALLVPQVALWRRLDEYWSVPLGAACTKLVTGWRQIGRRIWHEYWRPVVAFGVLFLVQSGSALLLNLSMKFTEMWGGANNNIITTIVLSGINNMLIGTLVLAAAYWVLYSLTNRYWLSLISVSALTLVFAIANRLKIVSRSEPVVPSDMAELSAFKELLGMVSPVVIVGVVGGLIIVIALIVLLERRTKNRHSHWYIRVLKLVTALTFLISCGYMHGQIPIVKNLMQTFGVYPENNKDMLYYAQKQGPVVAFLRQLNIAAMTEPRGYSAKTMQQLVKKYEAQAKTINQTRTVSPDKLTIMFNLSESFSNPLSISGLKMNKNPIPYVDKLKTQTTSGTMMSFGYGGGTANMEYMSLTGMSMGLFSSSSIIPNTQIVPGEKVAPNFGDEFHYASAIHPYEGAFYNRIRVYQKYNFQKFAYLGSKYKIIDQSKIGKSPYLSDKTSYANAWQQLTSRKGGQFLNLITMQNHMPYTADWYPDTTIP